jgi:hypothetical protein
MLTFRVQIGLFLAPHKRFTVTTRVTRATYCTIGFTNNGTCMTHKFIARVNGDHVVSSRYQAFAYIFHKVALSF